VLQDKYLDLLIEDYNNCFEQMRYYDNQINEYIKFIITFYVAVFGTIATLFGIDGINKISIIPYIKMGLIILGLLGTIFLLIIIKNRVYFVLMARYINCIRGDVFKDLKILNSVSIYTDKNKPEYWDSYSSQILLAHVCILFNCISFCLFISYYSNELFIIFGAGILLYAIQVIVISKYLKVKDRNSKINIHKEQL